ncbi:DNA-3-methyladenine glycosylase I [Chitinophaga ginsengisoli]|uniref:DNA-3-methyladenine glycosylase I n=1 Tax=Chitinophaga ginsengisoli TaxID=363837 RepID=A0A2P8FRQ8_9BACT|nr:DNA-3-methyladenine glycosylase I [Chitinophaga ginsengisoli]PSL24418.1 DNA-3-methyladenine glycosylase I [Chitinophaga ginsengisoli]
MNDYKKIFEKVEDTLREKSFLSQTEFDNKYGHFKRIENIKRTDEQLFEIVTMTVFYSGFSSAIVDRKKDKILSYFSSYETTSQYTENESVKILTDFDMIKNKKRIDSCIANAKTFKCIVDEHHSFQAYLDSFEANSSFENLLLLKEELEYRFEYLGGTTVYHFLMDLGYKVLKPDRVLIRIFKRLGLIESETQLFKTVIQGRKFAEATGLPIRYIDIIFAK